MLRRLLAFGGVLAWGLAYVAAAVAAEVEVTSDEQARALIGTFQAPEDLRVRFFADEGQLANPVAISLDPQGRLYVAEAHRKLTGVWGVAGEKAFAPWDYYNSTLKERMALYRRVAEKIPLSEYTRKSDILRLVEDRDGDGRADFTSVFAEGFDSFWDGNAAGVIERDGRVWFACIPHLWLLEDVDGDAEADSRRALARGFGVRIGVHGHDLHGLTWGPDGKLYFTVGDRGFNVLNAEGERLFAPTRGAAFRCNPDGSELEVFHIGLRNPQGLAFNAYGDLFTVDNNMSGGDESRVVYITEGGDSGWDATYQLTRNFREEVNRPVHPQPPWFEEGLWKTPHAEQPAWVNPSAGYLTRGPSGVAYYPGLGLPERFNDSFFVADFVGTGANSGVLNFKVEKRGAGYALGESGRFVWGVLATDIAFGFDGKAYVSDYISGWDGSGGGRVFTVDWPDDPGAEAVAEMRQAFAEGLAKLSTDQLSANLWHRDMRMRLRSQFELAKRGEEGLKGLMEAALNSEDLFARLHGIWGVGMLAKSHPRGVEAIAPLLEDEQAEVRAQVAKVLGDARYRPAVAELLDLLWDGSPRVRYHAALALGKTGHDYRAAETQLEPGRVPPVTKALAALAVETGDSDPVVRQAVALSLHRLRFAESEAAYSFFRSAEDAAVRMVAVLALRLAEDSRLADFLEDADTAVAAEAVRAVHDLRVPGALAELAAMADRVAAGDFSHENLLPLRVLSANFILGGERELKRLAAVAASRAAEEELRFEAVRMLGKFNAPSPFDWVTWHHAPVGERGLAPEAVREVLSGPLMTLAEREGLSDKLKTTLGATLAAHGLDSGPAALVARATEGDQPLELRIAAIRRLGDTRPEGAEAALASLAREAGGEVARAALLALASGDGAKAVPVVEKFLNAVELEDRRAAYAALSRIPVAEAATLLEEAVAAVGLDLPPQLWLDVMEAAEASPSDHVAEALEAKRRELAEQAPLGPYLPVLHGGDAERGAYLFQNHVAQCVRCHKIDGEGGEAGPPLGGVGSELDREALVDALFFPNSKIAEGYGTVVVTKTDGTVLAGVLAGSSEETLTLALPDGRSAAVPKDEIASQTTPVSAMPPMSALLSLREARDLVEYLSGLKE